MDAKLNILKRTLLKALPNSLNNTKASTCRKIIEQTEDIEKLAMSVTIRSNSPIEREALYVFNCQSDAFHRTDKETYPHKHVDFPKQMLFNTFIQSIKTNLFVLVDIIDYTDHS